MVLRNLKQHKLPRSIAGSVYVFDGVVFVCESRPVLIDILSKVMDSVPCTAHTIHELLGPGVSANPITVKQSKLQVFKCHGCRWESEFMVSHVPQEIRHYDVGPVQIGNENFTAAV